MSTTTAALPPASSSPARGLVELVSSMRFAIALLTVICIASVIGTVMKQAEPLTNYVNQFGPFWAELFLAMRLNTVYSAWWFLLILAFLVTSTSLCIARNTPKILADLKSFKENIRENSLQAFHHRAEGTLGSAPAAEAQRIGTWLAKSGWKVRLQQRGEGWMVAAKAGAANKVGYLAAHSAIVLVCLGGLLDGDLIVRAQMWWGGKLPYQGGGMVADVPAQHRLPVTNPTFRANILVAEGTQSSTAILNQSDGVLLQDLPFAIELKKFVVEHYSTGMPKLFASEIVIHDRETGEKIPARVEVNHPVRHRGIEIYQSSFDDGGSGVTLKAVPLDGSGRTFQVEGTIGGSTQLAKGEQDKMTLEFTGLRVMNVENLAGEAAASGTDVRAVDLRQSLDARLGAANKTVGKKHLRNVGPSITYKLRDAAGQAREFHNYMLPVDFGEGVPVFLLGVRDTPAESFRYLRVPADEGGSLDGFLRLRAALFDPQMREAAVRSYASQATDPSRPELQQQLSVSASRALALFAGAEGGQGKARGGLQAVSEFIETNVPEAERPRAGEVLVRILNGSLFELAQLSREKAGVKPLPRDDRTQAFMSQAVLALSDAYAYPAPVAFELKDFKQVQASVFQVTRSPGRYIVYLGCTLLILGIFAMLYVRERRLWVWLAPSGSGAHARMALSSNRKMMDVDREFQRLTDKLLGDKR
ncbi:MAG TPA: cytochrome c biogenesis protein ResB [Ramlibacter sp.]|jgi:cytochrome c biogenesis protein|nr:cytochrome c biogenesis protein ResB [Ramlibacter sp.]